MTNPDRAKKIVAAILKDLTDRKGLRQEWESIDEDIQEEVRQKWITIVLNRLEA